MEAKVMADHDRPIRVSIIQPSLAKYRVPVFRELASRPGIDLKVIYGVNPGVPNVVAEGFRAIPVHRWQRKIAGKLVMFQGAEWKYCSRRQSDVVVLRWSPRSLVQAPALLRARAEGIATILWGHGYSKRDRGWWRVLRDWLGKRASALLFYEPRTRDSYARQGWNRDRLFVALNSLDHTEIEAARQWWQERPSELEQFQRERGLDSGPVILFVSRLHAANHVEWLVQAAMELARQMPGLKTVIIGNGEAERERLKRLAAEAGFESSFLFEDGIYDELRLAPWFLSATVFCYPANMGLSLIHSLWYGLPVVASDRLDIQGPEVIALEPGVNGLSYEFGNVRSLVEALRGVITDEGLRRILSQGARRTMEGRFTIPHMVDGMEAAIRYAYGTLRRPGREAAQNRPELEPENKPHVYATSDELRHGI
jgi:glycosyltransferase involved in cell wall biosynthesis